MAQTRETMIPKISEIERDFLMVELFAIKKAYYWAYCGYLQA